jgi:hypothetical protein
MSRRHVLGLAVVGAAVVVAVGLVVARDDSESASPPSVAVPDAERAFTVAQVRRAFRRHGLPLEAPFGLQEQVQFSSESGRPGVRARFRAALAELR